MPHVPPSIPNSRAASSQVSVSEAPRSQAPPSKVPATVLEIVHVRCGEPTFHDAVAALRDLLAEMLMCQGETQARLLQSAETPHDLALHLTRVADPIRGIDAGELGLQIAAELRRFGPVSHSLWIEAPIHSRQLTQEIDK